MFFLDNIWLIPLLPALGAAIMLFFGKQAAEVDRERCLCRRGGAGVPIFCLAVWQYTNFPADGGYHPYQKILYTWLGTRYRAPELREARRKTARFHADAGFLLDPLSSIWLLFVTGVGMLIHIYSTGYMAHEGGYYRFFGYLNLFMFSMLTLILANNYVLMFVGWEGVGLCSYLLIGFYFHRKSASTPRTRHSS